LYNRDRSLEHIPPSDVKNHRASRADFPAELLAAIEAQKQAAARLTRSASFDQRFRKLSEQARKKGTVPVIVTQLRVLLAILWRR
jgi:hypothetical protein